MSSGLTGGFDYVAVGHVSADVLLDAPGGSLRQVGGGALYGGLQAARLGLRTLVLTRGRPEEIEQLIAPFAGELDLQVLPAACTTTLETTGAGARRRQRLRAWAGPIPAEQIPAQTSILHLAPIARETPSRWRGNAQLVGLTPQGLVRRWDGDSGEITLVAIDPAALPPRCDAVVFSESERASCEALFAREPLIAVTAGEGPTEVHLADGTIAHVASLPVHGAHDDLGAGDVFAAAFFIALHAGQAPPQAAAFGNAAAAVRIGGAGPDAIGDRSAIEARLA